ncbi:MAG: ABC transporter ATP-binding protein [Acidobacteriota bacterium]
MTAPAIRVETLGKKYLIRHEQRERYTALRDVLTNKAKGLGRRIIDLGRSPVSRPPSKEEFWALKDVSFEVQPGERIGIIGRNGAGKSTLLKLLSRITEPSVGRIELNGRVGSLLEVGTGFHPELTGRENIYLNGAILGMSKGEITKRFDEIVAFAEIEKFLDTPVKRYSSGMYVRLAFAVAAHLNTEILVVDEVLAVGDARFQERCLSKMEEVGKGGRTVLFVSHNMGSILRLTPRTILLSEGRILEDGPSTRITQHYLGSEHLCPASRRWESVERAPGNEVARLLSVAVKNGASQVVDAVEVTEPTIIEVEYALLEAQPKVTAILHLYNESGICLLASNDWNDKQWWNTVRKRGIVRAVCVIPANFLAEGRFFVLAALGSYNPNIVHALERDVVSFQAMDHSSGDGARGEFSGADWPGLVRPFLRWQAGFLPEGEIV